MGAFDVIPNITIPDPDDTKASEAFRKKWGWEPHEQVIMRGTFTQADQEAIGNAASTATKDGKIIIQAGTGRTQLLEQMIVDWTLTQNGRKVEVTPKNIRRLPAKYSTPILEECDKLAAAMSEEEQEDFLDSASEPSPLILGMGRKSLSQS